MKKGNRSFIIKSCRQRHFCHQNIFGTVNVVCVIHHGQYLDASPPGRGRGQRREHARALPRPRPCAKALHQGALPLYRAYTPFRPLFSHRPSAVVPDAIAQGIPPRICRIYRRAHPRRHNRKREGLAVAASPCRLQHYRNCFSCMKHHYPPFPCSSTLPACHRNG